MAKATKNKKATSSSAKKTSSKKTAKKKSDISLIAGYTAVYLFAAVLLGVFIYGSDSALVSTAVRTFLLGLFGKCAVVLPVMFTALAIYLIKLKNIPKFKHKTLVAVILLIIISSLLHLLDTDMIPISQAYTTGASLGHLELSMGGGLIGALIAVSLSSLISRFGTAVVLLALLVLFTSLITGYSLFGAAAGFLGGIGSAIKEEFTNVDNEKSYNSAANAGKKAGSSTVKKVKKVRKKYVEVHENAGSGAIEAALDYYEDMPKTDEPKKKRSAIKSPQETQKQEQEIPVLPDEPDSFENGINEIFGDMLNEADDTDNQPFEDSSSSYYDEQTVQEEKKEHAAPLTEQEKDKFSNEIEESLEAEPAREYVYPDIDILDEHEDNSSDSRKEMYETANKLISILENFGVKAKLLQVTQGSSVTRYEIQPNTGVKLSKISGLAEDLALNLAVPSVLVAPVPGKAAVGIEVPNREIASVYARELIESDEFQNSKSKLTVALGKDISGRVVVGDIAKMPHVLIAGSTGSGKSVCINTIITSILFKASPEEVKLIMVDPKVVELGVYNGIPHLLIPVVTDPKRAAGALNWAVAEMMHRYDLFASNSVRNLSGYNALAEKSGFDKLPQIVIIIDELADLMMVASKEIEDYVCRLAQLARAAGIHLIIATQRPSVDVITGLIKANIPSRIAFAVSSQVDSRTILDKGGAEKLLGRGDMLYFPTGVRAPMRVQGAFVSDSEIERLLAFIRENSDQESHYSEDLSEHIERCSEGDNGVAPDEDDDGDVLLPQAISLAAELGQISTAMIQRRLKVGYSRAGRIIDQMEERGIIGGANGSKPRQVYINHSDVMFND